MPSFDIVSRTDLQKLDNAINVAKKEISTRYDFYNSGTELELDKKELCIRVNTDNDMRMKAIQDIIIGRSVKQGIDTSCFDFGKEHYAAGDRIRKDVKVRQGIDRELGKKIVKVIKETGMKVQASIMDEQVRVTGKKIDDLQRVMDNVKQAGLGIPLQFENYR